MSALLNGRAARPGASLAPAADWTWQDNAACRGEDTALFFGPAGHERPEEREVRQAKAKEICAQCPVRAACLDYAIETPERDGTWGGLNEEERALERRRRQRRGSTPRPAPKRIEIKCGHCGGNGRPGGPGPGGITLRASCAALWERAGYPDQIPSEEEHRDHMTTRVAALADEGLSARRIAAQLRLSHRWVLQLLERATAAA